MTILATCILIACVAYVFVGTVNAKIRSRRCD
jgi:hypothetical protein